MVEIIAELGTSWSGNYGTLETMVEHCKEANIDAVKFQALSTELLERHKELPLYYTASVSPHNIKKIDKICSDVGIEWFCTPCYPEAVEFLNDYVSRWKIRHADNKRKDIISACQKTGKDIIISTDRPDGYWVDANHDDERIKPIYCIPKYPTDFGELNFDMIELLPGFSNHCLDALALFRAQRFGAKYIEFHLTADPTSFAIDNKVAFTYNQMDEFMRWLRV